MQQLALTANIFPLLARIGIVVIGGVVGYHVAHGARFELVLFVVIAASGFLLAHPERGLYLFCFTLILTNYEWRRVCPILSRWRILLIRLRHLSLQ